VSAPLVVSGKVVDAETKQPIKVFRVVPGIRSGESPVYWAGYESFAAADGQFQIRDKRGGLAHLVRIEADGYRPAVSRDIASNEGTVAIDFELRSGKNIVAKVVTPRNRHAAGANVALAFAGAQIHLINNEAPDGPTYCARAITDDTGRFQFPPQDHRFQLIITHPSGYAQLNSSGDWELARIIHLRPWARVEGTFRVGQVPVTNAKISMNFDRPPHVMGDDRPDVIAHYHTTTGPGGRFVFDRVIPSRGRIGRMLAPTGAQGAMAMDSSCMITTSFVGGQTAQVGLNGAGSPVVGKLLPPEGLIEKIRWSVAEVQVQPDRPGANNFQVTARVDREGKFRIDDMPPGNYSLSVKFPENAPGRLSNYGFKVLSTDGEPSVEPIDLGALRLVGR
jgi:hypothetical protein